MRLQGRPAASIPHTYTVSARPLAVFFDPFDAAPAWFADQGCRPFAFKEEVWAAYARGESGLIRAPTGDRQERTPRGYRRCCWVRGGTAVRPRRPPCWRERFAHLYAVIVDEWHELLASKRGVQAKQIDIDTLQPATLERLPWAFPGRSHRV